MNYEDLSGLDPNAGHMSPICLSHRMFRSRAWRALSAVEKFRAARRWWPWRRA